MSSKFDELFQQYEFAVNLDELSYEESNTPPETRSEWRYQAYIALHNYVHGLEKAARVRIK